MERRRFTREFKLEAVRLIKERGVSFAQASHDLSVAFMGLWRDFFAHSGKPRCKHLPKKKRAVLIKNGSNGFRKLSAWIREPHQLLAKLLCTTRLMQA
jgi:transposase-like protein